MLNTFSKGGEKFSKGGFVTSVPLVMGLALTKRKATSNIRYHPLRSLRVFTRHCQSPHSTVHH